MGSKIVRRLCLNILGVSHVNYHAPYARPARTNIYKVIIQKKISADRIVPSSCPTLPPFTQGAVSPPCQAHGSLRGGYAKGRIPGDRDGARKGSASIPAASQGADATLMLSYRMHDYIL